MIWALRLARLRLVTDDQDPGGHPEDGHEVDEIGLPVEGEGVAGLVGGGRRIPFRGGDQGQSGMGQSDPRAGPLSAVGPAPTPRSPSPGPARTERCHRAAWRCGPARSRGPPSPRICSPGLFCPASSAARR